MSTANLPSNRTKRLRMPSRDAAEMLSIRLADLQQKAMRFGSVTGLLWGALVFVVVMLAAAWIDIIFDLSPANRVSAWLLALIGFVAYTATRWWRTKKESAPVKLAHKLDIASGSGGQIRSGYDLKDQSALRSTATASLTNEMAAIAVKRASHLAIRTSDQDVVPVQPVAKAAASVAGIALLTIILAACLPAMASLELDRFFNPYADHPAYSQYEFDIQTNGELFTFGSNVEVSATVSGPSVEQLQLVVVPAASQRSQPIEQTEALDILPMFPNPSGQWQATIASVSEDFEFYLRVRNGRSRITPITVLQVPQIEKIEVTVQAPEYTRRSPYKGPIPKDGIRGLEGTKVSLSITSNRPLSMGEIEYSSTAMARTDRPLFNSKKTATFDFQIKDSGTVECSIADIDGLWSTSTVSIPVQRTRDESPFVRLAQPQATSFATPTATIPVVVSAEDDYGIRRCQVFRSLNQSRFLPVDLPLQAIDPTRTMPQMLIPIKDYDLQPGDEIRLFARVEDNDPNGPDAPIGKGAESSLVSIRIISQQEFDQSQQQKIGLQTMMNRYQQAQRRLERLADELKQLHKQLQDADPNSQLAKELQQKMQDIAKQMKQDAEALKQLADSPLPFELDQQLAPQLKKMAEQLEKLSEQLSEAGKKPGATNKEAADELKKQLEAIQKEQGRHKQEAMKPLEHLSQILPLKQAESEFMQLVQKQRSLADRLESLRSLKEEPTIEQRVRMRELAEEQNRIHEQLIDLVNLIEEKANALPDEPELEKLRETAMAFADAVWESGAISKMADAENSLANRDTDQAFLKADEAARLLEALIGQCKGMGSECENCAASFSPSLGECLSKTLQQMCPKPGSGKGGTGSGMGGSGGFSSSMSSMNNVGMYGNQPMMSPTSGSTNQPQSDSAGGLYSDPLATSGEQGANGFSASQSNRAMGGADWGVPSRYRRQTGKYLQQLADQLEE